RRQFAPRRRSASDGNVNLGSGAADPNLSPILRSMAVVEDAPANKRERWTMQWKELFDEVVTTGLSTGCSGCVIACPHDVLGYNDTEGIYKPFHLEEELGPDNCIHGEKGCTSCTRACPRFRTWETEIDNFMFGRSRTIDEIAGI